MIAAHYYVKIETVHLFNKNITETCSFRLMLDILGLSKEFEDITIRKGEENVLKALHFEALYKTKKPDYTDPSLKTNLIIQSVRTSPKSNFLAS